MAIKVHSRIRDRNYRTDDSQGGWKVLLKDTTFGHLQFEEILTDVNSARCVFPLSQNGDVEFRLSLLQRTMSSMPIGTENYRRLCHV